MAEVDHTVRYFGPVLIARGANLKLPVPAAITKNATHEVRRKEALDWPLATAGVVLKMKRTAVSEGRIVLKHVAPVPHHAKEASKWLAGKTITAAEDAVSGGQPVDTNGYKVQLAETDA